MMNLGFKGLVAGLFAGPFLFGSMPASAAASLEQGQYQGRGLWVSEDGDKGTYEVKTRVEGSKIISSYTLPAGAVKNLELEFVEVGHGFYDVKIAGDVAGKAYCVDHGPVCSYQTSGVEESIVSYQGKLYRYGSKTVNGQRIRWQESYEKASETK